MSEIDIEAVLEEFPEAKPFADLIVADDAEAARELARQLSERVRAIPDGESAEPSAKERREHAVASRDFSAYLKARRAEEGLPESAVSR